MAAEFKQTIEQKFLGLYGSSFRFVAAPVEEYLEYDYKNAKIQSAPDQIFHLHWQSDMFEDLVDFRYNLFP